MELSEKQINILEVAENLFAENGFHATSVRTIAKAAEVNVAMISYYFGSKEKLLDALMLYRTADFKIEIESVLSENVGYLQKVDATVALIINRIHRNRRIHKIVHFEQSHPGQTRDFAGYVAQKKGNFNIVKSFIEKGQEAGVFKKNINIPLIVPTILGTYFNFYYNQKFFQSVYDMPENTSFDQFVTQELIPHIQKTIKALLTYED